jgi:hypothetical protein
VTRESLALELVSISSSPVLGREAFEVVTRFGFEGGRCVKLDGTYFLFTTELFDAPKTAATRLALWESADGKSFTRHTTLAETNYDWTDTTYRMSPWSPMAIYDTAAERWRVFHVGYRRKPGSHQFFNMAGRIAQLESEVRGPAGIRGPYRNAGWLELGDEPDPWEGDAGQLSFFPFETRAGWFAFFGANDAPVSIDHAVPAVAQADEGLRFRVGLARASSCSGPWVRCSDVNPVLMDERFVENPVVTRLDDSLFVAVFDGGRARELSYSTSPDGVTWQRARRISLHPAPKSFAVARTPLGLIPEGGDLFSVYVTAFDGRNREKTPPLWHDGFGAVWRCTVKLVRSSDS